jgi:hypothetical protein
MRSITLSLAVSLVLGCDRPAPPAPAQVSAGAGIARIIVIDKEKACECTRARTDATLAALERAQAQMGRIPVERIHADTQPAEAGLWSARRPMTVLPALYLLDDENDIVAMLQGELDVATIAGVLAQGRR